MIIILAFFMLVLMLAVIVAVDMPHSRGTRRISTEKCIGLASRGRNWSGDSIPQCHHRMDQAGTLKFLVSEFLGYLALLLFAVSMGCGVAVFTYRRGTPRNHEREKHSSNSAQYKFHRCKKMKRILVGAVGIENCIHFHKS